MALQHFKISHRENRHVWEKNGNQLPVTYGAASQDDQNSKLEENTDDASESESAELKRLADRFSTTYPKCSRTYRFCIVKPSAQ